jgi:transcriptional antiterminator
LASKSSKEVKEMNHCLDSRLERQLFLLETLWEEQWMTGGELAEKAGSSEKTIRTDIAMINDYLSPMVIETSLKWGYFLKKDHSLPKAHIYAAVLKESAEYTLLEHLFFTPVLTRPEICDRLYISETQLGRWIAKINRYLQQFDFQIDTDLHYKGEEQKIRDFFSCFLNEKYGAVEGYFDAVKTKLIDQLIEMFLKETAVFSFIHNKQDLFMGKLKFQLLTRVERIKQGYQLSKPLIVFDLSSLLVSDDFYERFYRTFDVCLTNDVLYQLFYEFFSPLTLLTASRDTQSAELEQLRKQIEHEIHSIEENYHIKAEHTSRLVQTIYHSLMQVSFPTYILHHKKKEFFISFTADDPELAFDLKKQFSRICSILPLSEDQQEEIIYHGIFELLTSWRDLKKNVKNPVTIVSAALFLDTTYEHMRMIKEEIEAYFRNKINVDLILPQDKLKVNSFENYDCILSDMLIETDIPVIGIANYLNEETITKLLAFIHQKREAVQKAEQFSPFKLNIKEHQKLPLRR